MTRPAIRIEGLTPEEVLALPAEDVRRYVSDGSAMVLQIGTAQVLAEFRHRPPELVVVLAHIDGGGEGVLRTLHGLIEAHAARDGMTKIRWIVTAANCAQPNPKLIALLARMGFTIQKTAVGEAYVRVDSRDGS